MHSFHKPSTTIIRSRLIRRLKQSSSTPNPPRIVKYKHPASAFHPLHTSHRSLIIHNGFGPIDPRDIDRRPLPRIRSELIAASHFYTDATAMSRAYLIALPPVHARPLDFDYTGPLTRRFNQRTTRKEYIERVFRSDEVQASHGSASLEAPKTAATTATTTATTTTTTTTTAAEGEVLKPSLKINHAQFSKLKQGPQHNSSDKKVEIVLISHLDHSRLHFLIPDGGFFKDCSFWPFYMDNTIRSKPIFRASLPIFSIHKITTSPPILAIARTKILRKLIPTALVAYLLLSVDAEPLDYINTELYSAFFPRVYEDTTSERIRTALLRLDARIEQIIQDIFVFFGLSDQTITASNQNNHKQDSPEHFEPFEQSKPVPFHYATLSHVIDCNNKFHSLQRLDPDHPSILMKIVNIPHNGLAKLGDLLSFMASAFVQHLRAWNKDQHAQLSQQVVKPINSPPNELQPHELQEPQEQPTETTTTTPLAAEIPLNLDPNDQSNSIQDDKAARKDPAFKLEIPLHFLSLCLSHPSLSIIAHTLDTILAAITPTAKPLPYFHIITKKLPQSQSSQSKSSEAQVETTVSLSMLPEYTLKDPTEGEVVSGVLPFARHNPFKVPSLSWFDRHMRRWKQSNLKKHLQNQLNPTAELGRPTQFNLHHALFSTFQLLPSNPRAIPSMLSHVDHLSPISNSNPTSFASRLLNFNFTYPSMFAHNPCLHNAAKSHISDLPSSGYVVEDFHPDRLFELFTYLTNYSLTHPNAGHSTTSTAIPYDEDELNHSTALSPYIKSLIRRVNCIDHDPTATQSAAPKTPYQFNATSHELFQTKMPIVLNTLLNVTPETYQQDLIERMVHILAYRRHLQQTQYLHQKEAWLDTLQLHAADLHALLNLEDGGDGKKKKKKKKTNKKNEQKAPRTTAESIEAVIQHGRLNTWSQSVLETLLSQQPTLPRKFAPFFTEDEYNSILNTTTLLNVPQEQLFKQICELFDATPVNWLYIQKFSQNLPPNRAPPKTSTDQAQDRQSAPEVTETQRKSVIKSYRNLLQSPNVNQAHSTLNIEYPLVYLPIAGLLYHARALSSESYSELYEASAKTATSVVTEAKSHILSPSTLFQNDTLKDIFPFATNTPKSEAPMFHRDLSPAEQTLVSSLNVPFNLQALYALYNPILTLGHPLVHMPLEYFAIPSRYLGPVPHPPEVIKTLSLATYIPTNHLMEHQSVTINLQIKLHNDKVMQFNHLQQTNKSPHHLAFCDLILGQLIAEYSKSVETMELNKKNFNTLGSFLQHSPASILPQISSFFSSIFPFSAPKLPNQHPDEPLTRNNHFAFVPAPKPSFDVPRFVMPPQHPPQPHQISASQTSSTEPLPASQIPDSDLLLQRATQSKARLKAMVKNYTYYRNADKFEKIMSYGVIDPTQYPHLSLDTALFISKNYQLREQFINYYRLQSQQITFSKPTHLPAPSQPSTHPHLNAHYGMDLSHLNQPQTYAPYQATQPTSTQPAQSQSSAV